MANLPKLLQRSGLLIGCALALSTLGGGVTADIRDTKHNLSGRELRAAERGSAEREVCVFCHTPVANEADASSAERGVAYWPKWQRSVEATFSFELFDDIGRGDGSATQGAVGSVSMACLSCHDGVQALGITPGGGSDHPFGVPFRGINRGGEEASKFRDRVIQGQDAPKTIGGVIGDDADFKPARSATVNRRQIWWAATTTNLTQRSKSDLPLYPRRLPDTAGTYSEVPFVECTTCHDPHTTREVFLRTSNESSKLCMSCHIK